MIPHAAWPVEPTLLGPFLLAALLIELTPGPNMAWLAMVAASRGRAAGLAAVAGVTLGLSAYLIAGSLGAAQALAQAPLAYQTLRLGRDRVSGLARLGGLSRRAGPDGPEPGSIQRVPARLRHQSFQSKSGVVLSDSPAGLCAARSRRRRHIRSFCSAPLSRRQRGCAWRDCAGGRGLKRTACQRRAD
jgi:hypothetical protein